MSTFYLIESVQIGTQVLWPGMYIDDSVTDTAPMTTAGALLWPSSDTNVAAAAVIVAKKRLQGANIEECARLMRTACDSTQKTNDSQELATNGTNLANVADAQVLGGVEVVHVIAVADGVTADTDVVLTHKTEIMQIEVVKTAGAGGASDTLTVKNGTTAITDAMSINVADKIVVRPSTIDDAQTVIAAGGTLRCAMVKASGANTACRVIVRGVRRA